LRAGLHLSGRGAAKFSLIGRALCLAADQSNRRRDLHGYAAWEIQPVMNLQIENWI
jgi:hypothetical protein